MNPKKETEEKKEKNIKTTQPLGLKQIKFWWPKIPGFSNILLCNAAIQSRTGNKKSGLTAQL